jgi:hypothetical protein
LLGSGLLAVVNTTVVIEGNRVTSGVADLGGPAIVAANTTDGTCPSALDYSDAPIGFEVQVEPLSSDDGTYDPGELDLCVRNDGDETVDLSVFIEVTVDAEVGPCEDSEVSESGDTTCGDGDDGELVEAIDLVMSEGCGAPSTGQEDLSDAAKFSLGSLEPGGECNVVIATRIIDTDELRWQTDVAQFDVLIEGTSV